MEERFTTVVPAPIDKENHDSRSIAAKQKEALTDPLEKWEKFPPTKEDAARRSNYSTFRSLFMGDHEDVFDRCKNWLKEEADKNAIYIAVNFAGLLSKASADFLFMEEVKYRVGDPGSKEQEALTDILENNRFQRRCYEGAISASYRGDAVFKVRYGQVRGWDGVPRPIIESVPAGSVFPILNPDNCMEEKGIVIAWEKIDPVDGKKYLRKEIHTPGKIYNELWSMDGSNVKERAKLDVFYDDVLEEEETGYPGLLVEYVPNWRLDDRYFGVSDYYDSLNLMDALNNRISRIASTHDKHTFPKLLLPPGIMKEDPNTGNFYVAKSDLEAMEISPDDSGDLPKYLTWDAHLDSQFKELERLLDLMMMVTETSPALFGRDVGGQAESGRALKMKLYRTLAKTARKRMYFKDSMERVLYAAQYLDNVWGGGAEPVRPMARFGDGIPDDIDDETSTISQQISAGLKSARKAVAELQDIEGEELEEELKEIESDRSSILPEGFGGFGGE